MRLTRGIPGWLIAAWLVVACQPSFAESTAENADAPIVLAAASSPRAKVERYLRARRAYEQEVAAYWRLISQKRRARFANRRHHLPVGLDDYVLVQPPVYRGPPRPPGYVPPRRERAKPPPRIPVVADFLKAAAEQYRFVPQRPRSEAEFKRAYAKAAMAAGLTKDQAVRIYAFETGGNGTYDVQAGLESRRKGARPISAALGYNQLLSTNSVELIAEHGDDFVRILERTAEGASGQRRQTLRRKVAALRRMIAFSRTVPDVWSEHERLAKTTRGGMGIHAAVLDRDIGPLLQTQKLLVSVRFARMKGHAEPLTAAELELMNLTGDGNGIDMVLMPQELRERVPTANFFQRNGYERNPIARRTGTVAALFAAIKRIMDRASRAQGARDLANAF